MKVWLKSFLFLLLNAALLYSQWSQDPTVNTVLDKPGNQRAPLIATDGKGGAIVAWDEDNGVFANWVDRFGFRQWGNDGVRITPVGRIALVTNIISDGEGGAVIVWEDLTHAREVGTEVIDIIENEMFVQRVDSSGQLLWHPSGVAVRTKIDSTTAFNFEMVTSDHEEFIVVWTEDRRHPYPQSLPLDFFAQKIDLDGNLLWQENGALITVDGGLVNVRRRVVTDGAGGFLLARFGEGNGNTVVERISSEGELLWQPGGVPVNTGGAFDMDSGGQGGAVVAGVYFPGGGIVQVRVQRISPNGELLWGESATVVTDGADLDTSPHIVSDGHYGAYIYWDAKDLNGERKGFLQHIDDSGTILWSPIAVRFNVTSTIHPFFISDLQDGMILLAIDFFGTSEGQFWAVKADFDGNLGWTEQGVLFRQRPVNDWPFVFDVV
nr:hypothetical protein [candidate division KSB1 bacterium]NIR71290.1 hypothetical protein [candidate division KSB1 bacterium]NIS24820.1 hypothetical protein [candidate division KSB1 bacterium]NIT71726.1 hypothetical protein [candidate division KSB1 bacterium]NIU25455.1 hypothetical protein [candidate division KSB1 bacterium]